MKPITNEIVQELQKRGLSLDQYCGDSVVSALMDADFEHDYILKSIDNGEISTLSKSKYTEKEEIAYDEKKSGEHERRDYEEGKRAREAEEKDKLEKKKKREDEDDEMEKALQADFYKSQKEFLSDLSESLGEMKSIMKSIKDEISVLRDQPMPFRSVDKGAVLEKSFGVKTTDDGKKVLSKSIHREPLKRIMTECFEKAQDGDLKKSLANDIMSYSTGSAMISQSTIDYLGKQGIEVVE